MSYGGITLVYKMHSPGNLICSCDKFMGADDVGRSALTKTKFSSVV